MIYRVGNVTHIHLATEVLQLTADILEASPDWPRDAGRTHVEMRNWINELRAEIQHRELERAVALKAMIPDTTFDPPIAEANEDLR